VAVADDPDDDAAAPFRALYRRYRPQRFADVLGQEHVTRALRHSVRDGKVAHAYLFSGPRGTGKTSTARILAMALNCEAPADGEPDGTCPSCVAIRQGSSLDVQELDSATNRGIDEMRDLLGRVALGTPGRWKVYIIDEVHQMTSTAASALLKTLEEPPGHVIFVLATTDPQKVLPTIRSRTQHFEFRLLGADVLAALLRDVTERASLGVPPEAIDLVVRRGHGSARDALSALDQVAAAGGVDDEATILSDLVDAIAERDAGRVLLEVAEAASSGRDPRRIGMDLLEYLRDGFLAIQARSLVLLADDAAAEVAAQARRLGNATLVRAMELIGQALIDMRDSVDPRITLEVALVRLTAPEADDSRAALLERIERLEELVGQRGEPGAAPIPSVRSTSVPPRPETRPGPPAGSPPPVQAGASDPPPLPGSQSALGAHRSRRQERGDASTSSPAGPPAAGSPAAGSPAAGSPAAGPPAAGPPATGPPAPVPAAPSSAAGPPATAAAAPLAGLPTREALTLAWGDHVLPALRPGVKIYLSAGRFVGVDDSSAVYAVPDKGLLSRAEPSRFEVEAALSAHFGRPVPLRLVLDDAALPGAAPRAPADAMPEDPSDYDLDDLQSAPEAIVSPEQRVLEAFPGAEEVSS
jgi:DNA polymerase-3 subunit gamma/tau